MKIAVTSMGTEIHSQVDPRFGRARYIVILDENGTVLEAVDNSRNSNALKGAGIQAAKVVADRKVEVLVTGHCGPNAFRALQAAGVKVVVEQSGTVKDVLDRLNRNGVAFADQPNAEAHW
ncbi:MAG TPA: NifB/NifX family molybdenum-iron cluster-binding protein [Desulfomonilaceae bacterium]|nr:NifB/NifX family molybdenum-iron cluster-binding protein [Desulfomonilaceae bacterium]